MSQILIWGDSQAGTPGTAAANALRAAGHQVTVVHNDGKSPIAQTREPYWSQYVAASRNADVILLIFGHNSLATPATKTALLKMRNGVRPPVLMSGPPIYAVPEDRAEGDALRTMYAEVFGARYIDSYPSTGLNNPRVSATNPHFTAAGAVPWGRAMAAGVQSFLANPSPFGGGSLGPT